MLSPSQIQLFETKFRALPEAVRAEMKAAYPVLDPQIERLLRNSYAQSGITDPSAVSRLMARQKPHFQKILSAQFDRALIDLVTQIQDEHAALGVSMDTHISAYHGLLSELGRPLIELHRKRPERIAAAIAALNQCLLLDLDVTLALHVAGVEGKAAAQREQLARDLENNVHSVLVELQQAGATLRTASQTMSGTADETSRQAANVASAAGQASSNVQTVASAAEELSSAISEIARQVAQSASIARKAADEARRTDVTVAGLSSAAAKIGEIVKLIATIAGQTNLLALNATIEAARAGEAGKGFAVVAQEVKNLATQTAKATEDITGQVGAIQTATNETVTVMKGIGATITEINEIATTIAAAVEEQGAATNEIARNVQQAAAGTSAVSHTIEQVTRAATETGSAATRVLQSSESVSSQSSRLESAIAGFLRSLRQSA